MPNLSKEIVKYNKQYLEGLADSHRIYFAVVSPTWVTTRPSHFSVTASLMKEVLILPPT
jgi:hypothetical protein